MKLTIAYKLALGSVLLVVLSAGVVGALFYIKSTDLLVEQALEDISGEVRNAGYLLKKIVSTHDDDVLFLANTPPIQGLLRTRSDNEKTRQNGDSYQQWATRLQTIFKSQLLRNASYQKIRFINKQGQELITVGRLDSDIVSLSGAQLQNKIHRNYVKNALQLPAGSVYVSEINLNKEFGVLTTPYQQVIRSSTPVYDKSNGELAGLVAITVDIGEELRLIQKRIGRKNNSKIYITNDRGDYLLHPDSSKTFGFDLGKDYRIQEDIPTLAKLYLPDSQDVQVTLLPDDTGTSKVINFTKIPFDSAHPGRFIAVIITQDYDEIVSEESDVLNEVLVWSLLLIFTAVTLAILFSVRITRPIKQMTQMVNDFSHLHSAATNVSIGQGDEIDDLSRSFEAMTQQVEESQANLRELNDNLEHLVTERTHSLEQSEAKQRTILEAIADAIITFNIEGLITSFNPAAEKIFQYKNDEIMGQDVSILLPEEAQQVPKKYIEYSKLNKPDIINQTRDLQGRRRDGSLFPMELNVAPLQGEDRRGFVGILRDITDRKKAEQELNRFKTTLDETMDCVFMFEPDSLKFFYVNAGAMEQIGYSYNELMDMTPFEIKPDFDEKRFRDLIAPMINGQQPVMNFETQHQHKDGHIVPVEIFLQYIDPPGESPRFVAVVRDITERQRIDTMKNEFISTVSHELRTPLTSIRGSLGLLTGGAVGELSEKANEMLKIASNNTERLLLLINDILDIQKIESGQIAFSFQGFELMPFLQQALTDNTAYAEQHGVKFIITKQTVDARVYADKDRLMQVMANLLSNAAKFSPENETVEISIARHHGNTVRISVTDHGPGIPEDFQPKLFERFTQSDSSDTRQKGGTGLGLSITKVIVEKHGGHIGFVSHQGIGSTFYIELPELVADSQQVDGELFRQLSTEHQACVLIVEDDQDIAALMKRMLAENGFNSDITYDANEARKRLAEKPGQYKAITLDLLLPGEDGISLLDSLRRDAATHDIPVIVVSLMVNEAKRDLNGGAINVVDWLQKPIDQQRLIDAVKQATGSAQIPRVLHVEDEADVHKVVSLMLRDYCELTWTTTLAASKEILESEVFDLVLLDIGLPDGSGLDLLEIIEHCITPPRVVIFSANDVSDEYANKVSAVLVKSNTDNARLAEVISNIINQGISR